MIFRGKVAKRNQNMQIFASKKPSTATIVTLLPPLLPPHNTKKIRMLTLKVTVVAEKLFIL